MPSKPDELKKSRIAIMVLLVSVFLLSSFFVWFLTRETENDGGGGGGAPIIPPDGSDELSLVKLGPADALCINNILNNIDLDIQRFNGLLETDGKLGDYSEDDIIRICVETYAGQWVVNSSFVAVVNEVTGQQIPVYPSSETLVVAIQEPLSEVVILNLSQALFRNLSNAGFANVIRINPDTTFPQGITFITFLSIDRFYYVNETVKEGDTVFNNGAVTPPSQAFIRNSKIDEQVAKACNFFT